MTLTVDYAIEVLPSLNNEVETKVTDRRKHRRCDLDHRGLVVQRWQGEQRVSQPFGTIVDLSAGGIRIRTTDAGVRVDQQLRLRIELPAYAGISPFVDTTGETPAPREHWVGWIAVMRVTKSPLGHCEVAGRLVDMSEIDRAMLALYLSTQPITH